MTNGFLAKTNLKQQLSCDFLRLFFFMLGLCKTSGKSKTAVRCMKKKNHIFIWTCILVKLKRTPGFVRFTRESYNLCNE